MKKSFLFSIFSVIFAFAYGQDVPQDWFHLSPEDGYNGINSAGAYAQVKGKKGKKVIVAVIDSGVDWEHEDLDEVMWVNTGEIPGNGIDDDMNGYIDDIHGWNFIGGKDGKNVSNETLEVTRVYASLRDKYKNVDSTAGWALKGKKLAEYQRYVKVKNEVESNREKAQKNLDNMNGQVTYFEGVLNTLGTALKSQGLTLSQLDSLKTDDNEELTQAKGVATNVLGQIGKEMTIDEMREFMNGQFEGGVNYYGNQVNYMYNPDFESRTIVGDNYSDSYEKGYGNNDYEGPDAFHGTHVSGIIGAERGNGVGMDGVADMVEIMTIRAVPDGDERDKDVANAIIYAVDNGAEVINMSFGKGYVWDKVAVDKAVKYAAKNDVLLVHAAGNSSMENSTSNNFPNDTYKKKGLFGKPQPSNWIEVGALNHAKGEALSAPFSNYSGKYVDVFAPGMAIYSTIPDNKYQNAQGTSMASPVTAGLAALLRSYFPELSAAQIKQVIMDSVRPLTEKVKTPGSDEMVSFSELCVSGGTIDASKAVKMAASMDGKRKKCKAWNKNNGTSASDSSMKSKPGKA